MDIISRGAEAILYFENNMLVKERIKKNYRIEQIDIPLREKRTREESKLLSEARRNGVLTPKIFEVDRFKIKMEFIEGKRIKDYFKNADEKEIEKISFEIGKNIGKLHAAGIVHGDLTTSNMIYKDGKIYFIDFGLGFFSNRIEDFGTDLIVFKEAVKSTHFKYLNIIWSNILKGYSETNSLSEKIFKAVNEIEKRGRYKR